MRAIRMMMTAGVASFLVLTGQVATATAVGEPTPAADQKTYSQKGEKPIPRKGDVQINADGNLYAYEHVGYGGRWCGWPGDDFDWGVNPHCGWWRDIASSIWNNGYAGAYEDVVVHDGAYFDGPGLIIGNGEAYRNLHSIGWGDRIASHYWF